MDFTYRQFLPENFSPASRVWVYQSNRLFTTTEAVEIADMLKAFIVQWHSHGTPVKGYANLFFDQLLVFMADETATGVSGCSTDSSVRIIKEIEQKFKVKLFERQSLAFVVKGKIEILPLSQLADALENGSITQDTLYFNNLVKNKEELLNNWLIPVKESWLKTKIASLQPAK